MHVLYLGCPQFLVERSAELEMATRNASVEQEKLNLDRNLAQARAWYAQAAEAGHADATYNLGTFVESGKGYAPTAVPGLTNVEAVSAGGRHTCALLTDGGVSCWGDNSLGALGHTDFGSAVPPRPVEGLSGAALRGRYCSGSRF